MHQSTRDIMPRTHHIKRASRACEGCRVKKKRCIRDPIRGSPCDECLATGQICMFTTRRSLTRNTLIIEERNMLAKGLKTLFATARLHGCSLEVPEQQEVNPEPSLNYILDVLQVKNENGTSEHEVGSDSNLPLEHEESQQWLLTSDTTGDDEEPQWLLTPDITGDDEEPQWLLTPDITGDDEETQQWRLVQDTAGDGSFSYYEGHDPSEALGSTFQVDSQILDTNQLDEPIMFGGMGLMRSTFQLVAEPVEAQYQQSSNYFPNYHVDNWYGSYEPNFPEQPDAQLGWDS